MGVAVVVWTGEIGGAETQAVRLCAALRRRGHNSGVVFIDDAGVYASYLEERKIPYREMGLSPGSRVIRHPRDLVAAVASVGGAAAILPSPGYLGTVLRAGGYRGVIIGVEHGWLLQEPSFALSERVICGAGRVAGLVGCDALVCVSEYLKHEALRRAHPRRVEVLYNGVDLDEFAPISDGETGDAGALRVGAAGRLVHGKGIDVLLRAADLVAQSHQVTLAIAGVGDDEARLRDLAGSLNHVKVQFLGRVLAMGEFWRTCDIGVVPTTTLVESFGMVALEAMACGLPVVASANGGLPEVVDDGVTGYCVPIGSPEAIAACLERYATNHELRLRHSEAARRRAIRVFSIDEIARQYIKLIMDLGGNPSDHS